MKAGIWDELAIPPTADIAAIKRAYAARLKVCRPDDDPAGFMRLRAAYDAALRAAAVPRPPALPPEPPPPPPPPKPVAPPPIRPVAPTPTPTPEMQASAAIARGDVRTAAALLAARGDGTIPIGPWMRLSDRLAGILAKDLRLGDELVEAVAGQLGWLDSPERDATAAIKAVRRRVEARRWLEMLRADAARPTRFLGNERAAASALVLGKGRVTLGRVFPPYPHLLTLLSQVQVHGIWAERALDAYRLASLRALAADAKGQRLRRIAATVLIGAAFAAAGQPALAFVAVLTTISLRPAWLRRFLAAGILAALLLLAMGGVGIAFGPALGGAGLIVGSLALLVSRIAGVIRRRTFARSARASVWPVARLAISGFLVVAALAASKPLGAWGVVVVGCSAVLPTLILRRRRWPAWLRRPQRP